MDILAHALWANAIFIKRSRRERWFAILFALLPDFISFGPHFVNSVVNGNFGHRPDLERIDSFAIQSYNLTHSLLIALGVIIIVTVLSRRFYPSLLAWPLHVAIDIFSHSRAFFPTPFLFPFSDFTINAISWGNPTFMVVNYSLLTVSYILILLLKILNHAKHNHTHPSPREERDQPPLR